MIDDDNHIDHNRSPQGSPAYTPFMYTPKIILFCDIRTKGTTFFLHTQINSHFFVILLRFHSHLLFLFI